MRPKVKSFRCILITIQVLIFRQKKAFVEAAVRLFRERTCTRDCWSRQFNSSRIPQTDDCILQLHCSSLWTILFHGAKLWVLEKRSFSFIYTECLLKVRQQLQQRWLNTGLHYGNYWLAQVTELNRTAIVNAWVLYICRLLRHIFLVMLVCNTFSHLYNSQQYYYTGPDLPLWGPWASTGGGSHRIFWDSQT